MHNKVDHKSVRQIKLNNKLVSWKIKFRYYYNRIQKQIKRNSRFKENLREMENRMGNASIQIIQIPKGDLKKTMNFQEFKTEELPLIEKIHRMCIRLKK